MRLSAIVLGGIVIGLILTGCEEDREVATVPAAVASIDADFVVVGGEQFVTREGRSEAHLAYDTAYQWTDSTAVSLRRLELVVFHEDGTERARVTADRGRLDQATNQMVARGDVVLVVPGQERTLRSEELYYDPESERIWSDSAFVMDLPQQVLRGDWFNSDLEFRDFEAGRRR